MVGWRLNVAVGLAGACGLGGVAGAQEREVPEANPGRPTISTPATLTPVGYLQFENGGLYGLASPGVINQWSGNQVTKLTVTKRMQLLSSAQPIVRTRVDDGAGGVSTDVSPGDVLVGVQGVALAGEGRKPTVSMSYFRRVYEGPAGNLDIGSLSQSVLLLVSDDLGKFHVDANGIVAQQTDGRVRRGQFGQTLSISHPYRKVGLTGELWHFSQPLTGGNCAGSLWALSWAERKNLVWDVGFNRGLTSTSTRWEAFGGVTYVLPWRLWGKGSARAAGQDGGKAKGVGGR